MEAFLTALLELVLAATTLVGTLVVFLAPWTPLIAWLAFWLFAVNWVKLRQVLANGGWVGVLLLGVAAILVWSSIAPPANGTYDLLGLQVHNVTLKTVYVTGLICLMLLAGSVQLSGSLPACCQFPEEQPEEDHHAAAAHH